MARDLNYGGVRKTLLDDPKVRKRVERLQRYLHERAFDFQIMMAIRYCGVEAQFNNLYK